MKREMRVSTAVVGRWLAVVALVVLVLAMAGCEDWVASVADDVKAAYAIDIREPGQMATAAIGAQTLGDQEKADGLDVYRALRRVEYENKGDQLLWVDKEYAQARAAYMEALKWTPGGDAGVVGNLLGGIADTLLGNGNKGPQDQGTPAQRDKRAGLCGRVAWTYYYEAEATTNPERRSELKRNEAKARAESASFRTVISNAGKDYELAAYAASQGGDRASACTYAYQAMVNGVDVGIMRDIMKGWGCQ